MTAISVYNKLGMIFRLLVVSCLLASCNNTQTALPKFPAEYEAYSRHQLTVKGEVLPYRVLLPENYDSTKTYPLLLFLHGAGERGTDNELQLTHGADLFLSEKFRTQHPSIVVFPQCEANTSWSNYSWHTNGTLNYNLEQNRIEAPKFQRLLKSLLSTLKEDYPLDPKRLYIGGLSMGGIGTFETVRQNPNTFAAAFTICGGAPPVTAEELIDTKWWLFHGEKDEVIPFSNSKDMYIALKNAGALAYLTVYRDVAHDSWTKAFAEPELMMWLFSQRKD